MAFRPVLRQACVSRTHLLEHRTNAFAGRRNASRRRAHSSEHDPLPTKGPPRRRPRDRRSDCTKPLLAKPCTPISNTTQLSRKPIYDDDDASVPPATQAPLPTPSTPSAPSPPSLHTPTSATAPTPTDRLAAQVRQLRLFLHRQAQRAEDGANRTLTRALRLEHSFTRTVASLAPPAESRERLLPNAIYVLVAAMAGSIVTRRRNVLVRAALPAAVGLGTAYAVLPLTMRNVGDLVWSYERRWPPLADAHLRVRDRVGRFVQTGVAHSRMGVAMVEDKVVELREDVEEWVKKGK